MPRDILLKNVRLPLSFQWRDTTVEILLEGDLKLRYPLKARKVTPGKPGQ